MSLSFPYRIDRVGQTARSDSTEQHIREMLEQLLLTRPGERVNRPDLGCGLGDLIFGPNSPEVAAAVSLTVTAGVTQYLGDLIRIRNLRVVSQDSELRVDLAYEIVADKRAVTTSIGIPMSA